MIKWQSNNFSLTNYLNVNVTNTLNSTIDKTLIKPGNLVSVTYNIFDDVKQKKQIVEGIITKCQNRGLGKSFTLYYTLQNIKIQHLFVINSPTILDIKKKQSHKIRRAKLYYLYKKFTLTLKRTRN